MIPRATEQHRHRLTLVLIPLCAAASWIPAVSSAVALLTGVAIAALLGNPHSKITKKLVSPLLQWSIIGLGAGMDLSVVGQVGASGVMYTIVGISLTLTLGFAFAKWLAIDGKLGTLISVGTAICGGSAIAAIAPVIEAEERDVTVSLGTVFLLNAAALVIFPPIGHLLGLSQHAFGLWSALAIHDTSSVVGASMQFGPEALNVGTTTKLVRALWIAPVALLIGAVYSRKKSHAGATTKPKTPWFIAGFIFAAALVTYVPGLKTPGSVLALVAKRSLVMTLFLIGVNLTPAMLRKVGLRPILHGTALWIVVGSATLGAIMIGWIR